MPIVWRVMPEITDDFVKQYPEYDRVVLQLLFNRGLIGKKDIELFLDSNYEQHSHDPFLFNNMPSSVDLVIKHIKEQNKIVVYGDYDADGVTASAVLFEVLGFLKADVRVYIPDRVSEGYGLNKGAISELAKVGAKLIITVDSGIRSKEEVEYAKSLGLNTIITDHHIEEKSGELPSCSVINPTIHNEKYPFKYLAGVGVAFKLAKAIISRSTLTNGDKEKLEERVLDLVAIGTVADCVSLLGENRILVQEGLKVLNNIKRIGLNELVKMAQIKNSGQLNSWNIGFQIAPRLNAAGRMEHANTAFELLTTKDIKEAKALAKRLNDKNMDRQKTTEEITEFIMDSARETNDKIVVAVAPEDYIWPEGVIGLAAGKISSKYYKPALVITRGEEGFKGSGRSIPEFNIIKAIEECAEVLDRFGGHPAACGFSFKQESLEAFIEKIKKIANKKLRDVDLSPKINIEAELNLEEINEELVALVAKFAPFGQNNARPKFISRGVEIVDIMTMGLDGQHIRFKISDLRFKIKPLNAIGFGQAEQWKDLKIGDKIDIVYYAEMNEFNGRREAQLKIIDIKLYKKCKM